MLESLVALILVVIAIVGIAYHGFRDGGWVSQGFGKISDAYVNYPLMALAATVAGFFAYRSWRGRTEHGTSRQSFDYVIYTLMAVGIYFIGRYVLQGEL